MASMQVLRGLDRQRGPWRRSWPSSPDGLRQTCWFGFITIDDRNTEENPRIQLGLSPAGVTWSFTTIHDANWMPLTWLSLMLDTSLFGFRPPTT